MVLPHLLVQRIQPDVAKLPQRPLPEFLHFLVQLGAQLAHLAGRHTLHPERFQHGFHLPGAHAVDHRLLHHADQCLLAPPAPFQKDRDIAALAHLRNRKPQAPQPRIPAPFPVPVSIGRPFFAPFVRLSAYLGLHIGFHQKLRHMLGNRL